MLNGIASTSGSRHLRPRSTQRSNLAGLSEAGYCLLPGLLDSSELGTVRSLAAAYAEAPAHEGMSRPGSNLYPLRWDDRIVAIILGGERRLDRLRAAIGVRHLSWLSAYISSKPPGSSELAWHQDWWCWGQPVSLRRLAPQLALLCYLTECSETSGALRILPGSHTRSTDLHAFLPEPHSATAHSLPPHHPAFADHEDQVTARVAAGDAILIDYRLLHGTHRNNADRRRDRVLMSVLPDPDLLPSYIRSHLAAHPALPTPEEWHNAALMNYGPHIARFEEEPRSLEISRMPPLRFRLSATVE